MIDLKILKQGLETLAEEKRLPIAKIKIAMERAMAAAYQKEYGEKGQIIKCDMDFDEGTMEFRQIKIVVSPETVRMSDEELSEDDPKKAMPKYNEEKHIMIESAKLFKKNVELGEEISFLLDMKDEFGRIALQNAKQTIGAAIKEAEREETSLLFQDKINTIIYGNIERVERGNVFVDLGKATGILSAEEQIWGERYIPGNRIKAYFYKLEESPRGLSIRLSRTHPDFLKELFLAESPEMQDGVVEIVAVAREAGSRSKIAIKTNDNKVDPVGACVGQRGTRVNGISHELNGEKIDIILWKENLEEFIKESISPAEAESITIDEENKQAYIKVNEESLSLAIGKRGQNVRLAAKLTGYKIDIDIEGSTHNDSNNISDIDNTTDSKEERLDIDTNIENKVKVDTEQDIEQKINKE